MRIATGEDIRAARTADRDVDVAVGAERPGLLHQSLGVPHRAKGRVEALIELNVLVISENETAPAA